MMNGKRYQAYHCHDMKLWVFVCKTPKLTNPRNIIANPFMRTDFLEIVNEVGALSTQLVMISFSLRRLGAPIISNNDISLLNPQSKAEIPKLITRGIVYKMALSAAETSHRTMIDNNPSFDLYAPYFAGNYHVD